MRKEEEQSMLVLDGKVNGILEPDNFSGISPIAPHQDPTLEPKTVGRAGLYLIRGHDEVGPRRRNQESHFAVVPHGYSLIPCLQ